MEHGVYTDNFLLGKLPTFQSCVLWTLLKASIPIQIKGKCEEANRHKTAYLGLATRINESAFSPRKQGAILSCIDIKGQDKNNSIADKYAIRSHEERMKA